MSHFYLLKIVTNRRILLVKIICALNIELILVLVQLRKSGFNKVFTVTDSALMGFKFINKITNLLDVAKQMPKKF